MIGLEEAARRYIETEGTRCYLCPRFATQKTYGVPATCDDHAGQLGPTGCDWRDIPQAELVRLLKM